MLFRSGRGVGKLGPAADVVVVDAGFTEIAPGSATVMVTGGRYSGGGAGAGV